MTPEQSESLYRTAQLAENNSEMIKVMGVSQVKMQEQITDIHTAVVRQKGFVGGMMFVWSFLSAGGLALWGYFKGA